MKKLILLITATLLVFNVNAQGPNLEIYPGSKTVSPGQTFDVSFTVKELHQIVQINGSVTWDPTVLQFDTVSYFGLPYMTPSTFNTNQASNGTLTWMWQHLISIGGTLADGDSIFNFRFTAIGNPGQQSTITLGNIPVPLYWFNFAASTGSINSTPAQILIQCAPGSEPTAAFMHSGNQLSVNFSDNSMNASGWIWDFGDGTIDTTQNPTHMYASADTFTVCLIATNACGSDTTCTQVITSLTTGLDDVNNSDVIVYPNPANDAIFIGGVERIEGVELFTIKGEKVNAQLSENRSLNINGLKAGLYQLRIYLESKISEQKVLIE